MKFLKIITGCIIGLVVLTCLALIILPKVEGFQYFMGNTISRILSDKLQTEVSVGRVQIDLPNQAIVDDLVVYDRQHKKMLNTERLAANIELLPIIKEKKIRINSAQLYGVDADIYKKGNEYNFQFIIDAFASEDTTHTPLDLKIKDVLVKRANVSFNDGKNTYIVRDMNTRLKLNHVTDDDILCSLQDMQCKLKLPEKDQMLDIEKLSTHFSRHKENLKVNDFCLKLPETILNIDSATYNTQTRQFSANILSSTVASSDLEPFVSKLKGLGQNVNLSASLSGSLEDISVSHVNIYTRDGALHLDGSGFISDLSTSPKINAQIKDFSATSSFISSLSDVVQMPDVVKRLGDVHFSGDVSTYKSNIMAKGTADTSAGSATIDGFLMADDYEATIATDGLDLQRILDDSQFGRLEALVKLHGSKDGHITGKCEARTFEYKGHTYHNIIAEGKYAGNAADAIIKVSDPDCDVDLTAKVDGLTASQKKEISLQGIVNKLNPSTLNLTKAMPNTTFSGKLDAALSGTDINNIVGKVSMQDFSMVSPQKSLHVSNIDLTADMVNGNRQIAFSSDFANMNIQGDFSYDELFNDVIYSVKKHIPSAPGIPDVRLPRKHKYAFDFSLENADVIKYFTNLPITISQPFRLSGNVDDYVNQINIDAFLPQFTYDGGQYSDCVLHISSPNDTIMCDMNLRKHIDNNQHYNLDLSVAAVNDRLSASASWNNPMSDAMNGNLNVETTFFRDKYGKPALHVDVLPSELIFSGSKWTLKPSQLEYANKKLTAEDFTISHGEQFLNINGVASDNRNDSLIVDMNDLNVEYIMDIVDFHSVDFAGLASGRAVVSSVFSKPDAYADVSVKDFKFENGRLGNMKSKVLWNKNDGQLEIDADIRDENDGRVSVDGFISIAKNSIDLNILPHNANLEFLSTYVSDIIDRIDATCSGDLRLVGPLNAIQLLGKAAPSGSFHVSVLGTDYEVRGDTVSFVPNDILIKDVKAYDKYDNSVLVNGGLHHDCLKRLTFDLDFDADRILAYDFDDFYGNMFYGTVFANGSVRMHGISGETDIDGELTALKGTTFTYNAVVQNYLTTQKFITFRDVTVRPESIDMIQENPLTVDRRPLTIEKDPTMSSNLYCNFTVDVNPDAQIRVLMDNRTNDYITLYGDGRIKASYYNKGKFSMYGTYTVDHGNYTLTVQNILKKDFQFNKGGTIAFGGDPYDAILNLQANYPVNNVSLSDLSVGNSFTSNTIRVNCLMNITGQPKDPRLSFDLDMPTVNTDEKQMIRSIINSEEDMNQQVIYLLGIGRFYAKNTNNADEAEGRRSQTSLAMQSLLSGTISSQLNSMLSHALNTNNWNLGANISTGTEGWNNAQYEGQVSGRMFNNRLIFNGQFGYRDNINTAKTTFIGDFDLQYLLLPNGNLSVRAYNQTNERYFTKSALNTQGLGIQIKKDFNGLRDLFSRRKKTKDKK